MLSTLYFASHVYVCSHVAGLFWQYMSVNNHKCTIWLNYLELQNSFNNSDYFTNLQKPRFKKTFTNHLSIQKIRPRVQHCKVHNPWIALGGWHGHMTWSLKLPKNQGEGHQGPKGYENIFVMKVSWEGPTWPLLLPVLVNNCGKQTSSSHLHAVFFNIHQHVVHFETIVATHYLLKSSRLPSSLSSLGVGDRWW